MKRLTSEKGPKAIGAYSVATRVGDVIYTSGQIAIDPQTGDLVEKDIIKQTHQVMNNLQVILEQNDSKLDNIIKTTIYLEDINDFSTFNEVYAEYFEEENYPSRTAVEIAALPKEAKIEIDVIALVNKQES